MPERAGMGRQAVLHAASVGGRQLENLGGSSAPDHGSVADRILLEENPLSSLATLSESLLVITRGRVVRSCLRDT